ncbi:MAG: hypothetical protein ACHREM_23560 [Polyangiales bacterium]
MGSRRSTARIHWTACAALMAATGATRHANADEHEKALPALEAASARVPQWSQLPTLELGASERVLGAPIARRERRPEADHDDEEPPLTTGTRRLAERFYELGMFTGLGGPLQTGGIAGGSIGLTGIQVLENHGYISKFTIAMLIAMGQPRANYVGSTTTYSGGYVYRTDYYTPLTDAQRAAQAEQIAGAINGEYVMELKVYTDGLWGLNPGVARGSGFEFYLGGQVVLAGGPLPWVLEIAGAASYLSASNVPFNAGAGPSDGNAQDPLYTGGVHNHTLSYTNFGVMLRMHAPINEYFELFAQWDLNALQLFSDAAAHRDQGELYTSPLRLGAIANVTDRVYLRGLMSLNSLGTDGFGYEADLGLRF